MPHVSEVHPTSHDRHDPMLVAALAAGDLAGTDRDQAVALTTTCRDCALLHDDLVALARAVASVPPPIAARPRDFQLTPADAARLRTVGWRRFVGMLSGSRSAVSRPLGAGLATLGLVGLLVGNVSLSSGSSAASPADAGGAAIVGGQQEAVPAASSVGLTGVVDASSPPRSAAGAPPAAPSTAATVQPPADTSYGAFRGSATTDQVPEAAAAGPTDGKSAQAEPLARDQGSTPSSASAEPFRPLNLLFGAAILVGLGLLLASLRRGRSAA